MSGNQRNLRQKNLFIHMCVYIYIYTIISGNKLSQVFDVFAVCLITGCFNSS